MNDDAPPDVLVQRLHSLAVERGLTIKDMAERCGVPKSSLEGYMRLSGAKRPGIDAVIAIADAMGVSIDWLVGRSDGKQLGEAERKKLAYAVFRLFSDTLHRIDKAQEETGKPAICKGKIAGKDLDQFAVEAMLHIIAGQEVIRASDLDELRILNDLLDSTLNSEGR